MAAKNGSTTTRDNSVPVTAADVNRFRNPVKLLASNSLINDGIAQTLHRCACVVSFLSDSMGNKEDDATDEQFGLYLAMQCVVDCLEKQAFAISGASHGE